MTRTAAISIAVVCLVMVAVATGRGNGTGGSLPAFSARTLDGTLLTEGMFTGRPVLLIFWNTWCPLCRRELPAVDRLARRFAPRGLAVLAVNTALNDSEKKARSYWAKSGYLFPTVFDSSFRMGQAFKVLGVPTVLLVDAAGRERFRGSLLPDDIEERLTRLTPPAN